jgi:DNA polymerase-3 subunit epsilon
MDFLALDFETDNESLASICQVGVANFGRGNGDDFSTLIDPEDYFAGINISIHGIAPEDVVGAPTFPDVYPTLADMLSGHIVVSHTAFDQAALKRAITRYELPEIKCQ